MKRFRLFVLSLVALALLPIGAALAQQDLERVDHATALHEQNRFIEVHGLWARNLSQPVIEAGLRWLGNHLAEGTGPSTYAITFAGLNYVTNTKDSRSTALANMYFFELRQLSITIRCDDKSVIPTEIRGARTGFAHFYEHAATLTDEEHTAVVDQAYALEWDRPFNDLDFRVCATGVAYARRYAEKHGAEGLKSVEDPNRLGQTFAIGYDPDLMTFMDDARWKTIREGVHENFRRHLIDSKPQP